MVTLTPVRANRATKHREMSQNGCISVPDVSIIERQPVRMIVPGGVIAVELRQVGTGELRSSTVDCSLFICRAQSQKVLVGIASNRGGKALRHVAWAEMRVFVCGSISSALRRNAHYSFLPLYPGRYGPQRQRQAVLHP